MKISTFHVSSHFGFQLVSTHKWLALFWCFENTPASERKKQIIQISRQFPIAPGGDIPSHKGTYELSQRYFSCNDEIRNSEFKIFGTAAKNIRIVIPGVLILSHKCSSFSQAVFPR